MGNIHSAFDLLFVLEKAVCGFPQGGYGPKLLWGTAPCRLALLWEEQVVLIGLGNSSSWIPVLDFRPTCERGQWFSIDTFAESCVRAGLEGVWY